MRQFIVLGYTSNNTTDPGECLYLGVDRGEALAKVNEAGHLRRELFDLASPHVRRHFIAEEGNAKATKKTKSKAKDNESVDGAGDDTGTGE